MSSCKLSVHITNPQKSYFPGQEIHGEVVVTVDSPLCQCNQLTLSVEWRTHGKGNTARGLSEIIRLFQGEWNQGEYRYPFTIKAPLGPFTYRGHYLNIDWYLKATADIPWAIDPTADTEFLLEPPPGMTLADPYYFGPKYTPPVSLKEGEQNPAVSLTPSGKELPQEQKKIGIGSILVGLLFALVLGALLIGLPFFALFMAPFILFFAIKKYMVQSKLGVPDVQVEPRVLGQGDNFEVSVRIFPKKEVSFGDVYAEILGREKVVRGSGTSSTTYTHPLHKQRYPFNIAQTKGREGEPIFLQKTIPIPEDAAFTFVASDNHIEWTLRVHIELLGWPDWEETYPLTIRPGQKMAHPFR